MARTNLSSLDSVISNQLTPHLLLDPQDDHGIDHDFITEAISRFSEDESVKDLLVGAVENLSQRLSQMTMNDDYRIYVTVCAILLPARYSSEANHYTDFKESCPVS